MRILTVASETTPGNSEYVKGELILELGRQGNYIDSTRLNKILIDMKFRKARSEDLPAIVKMIAEDKLGSLRENYQSPLPNEYLEAFQKINVDPNQELIVLENEMQEIIGTLQLTFIQYLTYRGGIRAQIEAVRVRQDQRGAGLGKKMFEWAIERAKERKAHLLQLTTDKKRPEAVKFYQNLGFIASHEGMKLHFK